MWPKDHPSQIDEIQTLRVFYRGKELQDDIELGSAGIQTEAKNEEGLVEKIQVGMLVHVVKKGEST